MYFSPQIYYGGNASVTDVKCHKSLSGVSYKTLSTVVYNRKKTCV